MDGCHPHIHYSRNFKNLALSEIYWRGSQADACADMAIADQHWNNTVYSIHEQRGHRMAHTCAIVQCIYNLKTQARTSTIND